MRKPKPIIVGWTRPRYKNDRLHLVVDLDAVFDSEAGMALAKLYCSARRKFLPPFDKAPQVVAWICRTCAHGVQLARGRAREPRPLNKGGRPRKPLGALVWERLGWSTPIGVSHLLVRHVRDEVPFRAACGRPFALHTYERDQLDSVKCRACLRSRILEVRE